MLDSMVNQINYEMNQSEPDKRSWLKRLKSKLFPVKHCFTPSTKVAGGDCVHIVSVSKISFLDRLRVLMTGIVVCESKTVTGFVVGWTETNSVCYIGTKEDWDGQD